MSGIAGLTAAVVDSTKALAQYKVAAEDTIATNERLADSMEDVPLGDALRQLIEAGGATGDPYSGHFDKDTGQFLGGAFSSKYAYQLLEGLVALERSRSDPRWDPAKFEMNRQEGIGYYTRIFGERFGKIENIIRELLAFQNAQTRAEQSRNRTAAARPPASPAPSTSSGSIAIQFFTGRIP